MSEQMEFRRNVPYPSMEGVEENAYYARLLLESYAGQESEFTAITQYIYHHIEAESTDSHAASCLRGIAIVEMHHLDLLGGLIRRLGVPPRYRSIRRNRPAYWDARSVRYGRDLRGMLVTDLEGERCAIDHYRQTIRAIREPRICNLLERIIQDEQLHMEILESLMDSVQ